MNLGLEGKVAVITGGSDGIGKAAALSMSREGARVAIAARDQSRLDAAVADISDQTQNSVLGISTDVRDEDSVRSLISQPPFSRSARLDSTISSTTPRSPSAEWAISMS